MSSDAKKPGLKLVNPTFDLDSRNYWNTVGADKEFFPTEPRKESIPTFSKQGRIFEEPTDAWWINSEKHHYCFWTFLKERSQLDGTMEPLLQSEISNLFGCSSTKIHFILKEALDHLTSEENMKILQNLMELTEGDPEEDTSIISSTTDLDSFTESDDSE